MRSATGGEHLAQNGQSQTNNRDPALEGQRGGPGQGADGTAHANGSVITDIVTAGDEITDSIREILRLLVHRKDEIETNRETLENQIDVEIEALVESTDPSSQEAIKGFERKRNELYQRYLKQLGDVTEQALHKMMEHLDPLPDATKFFGLAIHELEVVIKEIDRSRRKFAVDLRKRIDGRKQSGLEQRVSQITEELEQEQQRSETLKKEVDDLTRSLGMNQAELRKRIAGEDEWKVQYREEIRKRLVKEVRDEFEREMRGEIEREIRAEIIEEMRGTDNAATPITRQVKQPVRQENAIGTYPFVRCPSCSEKIEVRSADRPVIVRCPGCGNEYTIRDKTQRNNPGSSAHAGNPRSEAPGGEDQSRERVPNDPPGGSFPEYPERTSSFNGSGGGTKEITCPYCSKTHIVPTGLRRRLTCSCGRRIRTD